jgi:hypothetical protein
MNLAQEAFNELFPDKIGKETRTFTLTYSGKFRNYIKYQI